MKLRSFQKYWNFPQASPCYPLATASSLTTIRHAPSPFCHQSSHLPPGNHALTIPLPSSLDLATTFHFPPYGCHSLPLTSLAASFPSPTILRPLDDRLCHSPTIAHPPDPAAKQRLRSGLCGLGMGANTSKLHRNPRALTPGTTSFLALPTLPVLENSSSPCRITLTELGTCSNRLEMQTAVSSLRGSPHKFQFLWKWAHTANLCMSENGGP